MLARMARLGLPLSGRWGPATLQAVQYFYTVLTPVASRARQEMNFASGATNQTVPSLPSIVPVTGVPCPLGSQGVEGALVRRCAVIS